jgi:hypothetical protein
MKLLKASFLLAAAATAISAHADITEISGANSYFYGSLHPNSTFSTLLVDGYYSPDIFWSSSTGTLTGSSDNLTILGHSNYRFAGASSDLTKLAGFAYDGGTNRAILWNPLVGTNVKLLSLLSGVTNESIGRYGYGSNLKFTVSADVSTVYGAYYQGGTSKLYRWSATSGLSADLLGSVLPTGEIASYKMLMTANASSVAGYSQAGSNVNTFYWSQATGAKYVNADVGNPSYLVPTGFSGDGSYLFVGRYDGSGGVFQLLRWKASDGTYITIPKPSGTDGFDVNTFFASADGNTAVGINHDATTGYNLFKWTQSGGTTGNLLASLSPTYVSLNGVSADLNIAYGYFMNNTVGSHVFRRDHAANINIDLQAGLTGSFYAAAMSANGNYIVGQKDGTVAWRWSAADGYQTISDWLLANGTDAAIVNTWTFKSANDVSEDGNTVVGYGSKGMNNLYYIASATSGVADYEIWLSSINGQNRVYNAGSTLAGLPLEGAHHRPMMSFDRMGKESQAWATGDFGSSSRTRDVHVTSGEAGINWNVGKTMLFGVAGGHAVQNADLDLGGSSATKGDFFIAELDYRPEGTQWIVSLLGMVGSWESKTNRGYDNGAGTDFSSGVADTITRSARLRVDAPTVATFGGFGFAPYASYTVTQTIVGGYTETGGGFPASFNEQEHNATEARLGVTASKELSAATKLLLSVEAIHRFDGVGPALTGQDVTGGVAFSLPGVAPRPDCVRFGFDVDHKLSADTLLNISAHASTVGEAHDVSAAISIRRAF